MIAKTFHGLEDVLAQEIIELGGERVQIIKRAVSFYGDNAMMYRANYYLRTAINILKPVSEFVAFDEGRFYKKIRGIDWSQYMSYKDSFMVTAVTFSDVFKHSKYIALKTKDAIVDQFRDNTGIRPSVDTQNPDIRINLHITDKKCIVLLDSSGDPLFKRGYRTKTGEAPINEVLAAGMIKLSGWDKKTPLHDPMCGSGTLLIEAALLASNIAPGAFRKKFGFMNWKDYQPHLFEKIAEGNYPHKNSNLLISGADIDDNMLTVARENIRHAGLQNIIKLSNHNFFLPSKYEEGTTVITNPPYGERLKTSDLQDFYTKIGDKFKSSFAGSSCWVIGSNIEEMKFIGLKPDKKIKLFNGPLECSFRKYSIFKGKRNSALA